MKILLAWALVLFSPALRAEERPITVGSKAFTESYVLSEIISQIAEGAGEAPVTRKFDLGGTGIVYQALANQEIDLYPEYTGTISEEILKDPTVSGMEALRGALARVRLRVSEPLGFNNTYALAVRRPFAEKNHLKAISDLKRVPDVRAGLSHEFMERKDGYPGLTANYGLRLTNVKPVAHALAYEALAQGEIDLTDVYSTDAKIEKLDLVVLQDDRGYFPAYFAVLLARQDFVERYPRTWAALKTLEGRIDEKRMISLNAQADIEKKGFPEVASGFLKKAPQAAAVPLATIAKLTRQHLFLVGVSLLFSLLLGLPLGILASRQPLLGQAILGVSGLLQTIPSLALLCFLIPVFGIGAKPALFALFLYGLLPIVTGVHTGLRGLDPRQLESATALGLAPGQRLRLIELPLASRSILAGIRTSVIIGIGTATLAALIGAGGYGVPIVTGLALNDLNTILTGAIPAAVLALFAHAAFEALDRLLIPKGIR